MLVQVYAAALPSVCLCVSLCVTHILYIKTAVCVWVCPIVKFNSLYLSSFWQLFIVSLDYLCTFVFFLPLIPEEYLHLISEPGSLHIVCLTSCNLTVLESCILACVLSYRWPLCNTMATHWLWRVFFHSLVEHHGSLFLPVHCFQTALILRATFAWSSMWEECCHLLARLKNSLQCFDSDC